MKTMSLYEPALCCETGVCGPGVDRDLLRITTVFKNLHKDGATVARFNLNNEPQAFINNAEIKKLIDNEGVDALPATVVDGVIVKTKTYPTNEEITEWLELPKSYNLEEKATNRGCGCKPGCC